MRRKFWVLIPLPVLLASDLILANIPGPVPTEQAIYNVEHESHLFRNSHVARASYHKPADSTFA